MKLKHDTVLFGNVIDEVTEQIAHAVNLDAQACAKRLFCALQKLCLNDLLYLNQEVRARFPYLATVFSGQNWILLHHVTNHSGQCITLSAACRRLGTTCTHITNYTGLVIFAHQWPQTMNWTRYLIGWQVSIELVKFSEFICIVCSASLCASNDANARVFC